MKLYQPVMFVGLGGTGCDIGSELERRLREEICGPDGNDFRRTRGREGLLSYQLPSCLQFVYADMNQAELDRLPRRVVPGPEHVPAAALTARYVSGLVPDVASYPELARNLRLGADRVVDGWLPPSTQEEPRVNPLYRGAGQFPTIGRAALFGTFMESITPAVRDLREAIGRLANSGEDLQALGGGLPRGADVFVAFSVAGGTGCGIFYDYLHLIAHMLQQSGNQLRVKIYPLVLMPSAFEDGLGGGRAAQLNSGRALLDLFRLVDQQNGADAERELHGGHDQVPIDPEEVAVYYPGNLRIVMRPGTLQTGFLFSQPAGANREDMHRSIVSLVMSLVGTEMTHDDGSSAEHHQSFADSFVNQATHRQVRAENGIGNRGVSTALVASLTVPVDDLAGIVGARLLRTAIDQISTPESQVESTRSGMEDFLVKAGIHPVLRRHGSDFAEPEPANGAREVTAALNDRRESMRAGIDSLKVQLGRDVPQLVQGFDPDGAVRELLGKMDIYRVQRVAFGHSELSSEVEQGGVSGMLHRRRAAPEAPTGHGVTPPPTPELRDKLFRKVQWNDEEPVAARGQQDEWYKWQTHVAWAEFWARHTAQWRRPLDRVQLDLAALAKALTEFARQDVEDFSRRAAELYRRRVGVSYLLPAGTGRMEQFYHQVVRRMLEHYAREGRLNVNSTESKLVETLVGASGWRETYDLSVSQTPDHAVSFLREQVKTEVKRFLREPPSGEQPMLPRLQDLLSEAAGHGGGTSIMQDYLDEFRGKLAGLLPANFTPQGSGPLKVLISYPADAPSDVVKGHLMNSINLPGGPRTTYDYRNTHTESISVVLFRTAMGVTEVEEVREVLRYWADALFRPEPTDLLRWRQRTGYNFGYLATREEHRVEILHRLLSALWNGRATIRGPEDSPNQVSIELGGGVVMKLPLTPVAQASSWGSLLRSYELWALDDDDIHRRFCGQLMREMPEGLDGRPKLPGALYMVIRDMAEGQIELLDDMMKKQPAGQRSRAALMRAFWADTLPATIDQVFTGQDSPVAQNLRELEQVVDAGGSPMTVEVLRLDGLPDSEAEQAADTLLADFRGHPNLSKLLVLDSTAALAQHAPIYERLITAKRVEDLLCMALGPRAADGREIRLPGNLGGTQGSGVLWVSDPLGIDWRVATSAIAIGHPGVASGLDRLVELLSVDKVFDRMHQVLTTSVPGRVASPGLRLAGADDEGAVFAGALAVAIRRLSEPGSGYDGPFASLLPAAAEGASLDADGELSRCQADVAESARAAADALAGATGIVGRLRRGDRGARDYLIEAGTALADLRGQVAQLLRDASATGELTDYQRRLVLAAGVRLPAPTAVAEDGGASGAPAQSPVYRAIADALRDGDTLALVTRRLKQTERELKRHGSGSYLEEVEQRCPPSLLTRLADPPPRSSRHAADDQRGEPGPDEATKAASELTELVIAVADREWSSAAAVPGEVARIRIALSGVSQALAEYAEAARDADGARGTRMARLAEILMPILCDLALRAIAAESASPSVDGREALEHARASAAALLEEWARHTHDNGVLVPPAFATSVIHELHYAGEDDVADIKEAIRYEPRQEMWQLCAPDDLSALDAAVIPRVVEFAPRLNRDVLISALPPDTVWTSSGSYAGLIRLVPLRAGIVSSSWGGDARPADPSPRTEPS